MSGDGRWRAREQRAPYTPGSGRHIFHADHVTFGIGIRHEGWGLATTAVEQALAFFQEQALSLCLASLRSEPSPVLRASWLAEVFRVALRYAAAGEDTIWVQLADDASDSAP